jgi:hypothetical protein
MPKISLWRTARNTIAAAMASIALLPVNTFAGMNDAEWNPPARFDHAYSGKLTVKRLQPSAVEGACSQLMGEKYTPGRKRRGCARWWTNPDRCTVILIDRPAYGTTPKAVFRHEIGHCNRWPQDHPD